MATPITPCLAKSSSHDCTPSLLPPVPCSTITTGSLLFASEGETMSTGTRSVVPSGFFSLANDHRETTSLAFSVVFASSRTSDGTFGRSRTLRSAAFAFSGGSTFSCAHEWRARADERDGERDDESGSHGSLRG